MVVVLAARPVITVSFSIQFFVENQLTTESALIISVPMFILEGLQENKEKGRIFHLLHKVTLIIEMLGYSKMHGIERKCLNILSPQNTKIYTGDNLF